MFLFRTSLAQSWWVAKWHFGEFLISSSLLQTLPIYISRCMASNKNWWHQSYRWGRTRARQNKGKTELTFSIPTMTGNKDQQPESSHSLIYFSVSFQSNRVFLEDSTSKTPSTSYKIEILETELQITHSFSTWVPQL